MSSTNDENIRVRHGCVPKRLVKVNKNLTHAQVAQIRSTPFQWVINMPEKLKISCLLMWELVRRWDECSEGFRVRDRIVPFTPSDVCLAVGLPVVGEHVPVNENEECNTLSLFDGGEVIVDRIVDMLTLYQEDDVNFCRLYILLACGEFYSPSSGRLVYTGFIKLLDDLQSLNSYNWGLAVYDFLAKSLSKVYCALRVGKNQCQRHICGCAAVLQIWAMNHISVGETPDVPFPFPCFLNWQPLCLGKEKIQHAFENNLVTVQRTATPEELVFDMVRDALQQAEHQFIRVTDYQQLVALIENCQDRISVLEAEVKRLKDVELQRQSTTEPQNEYQGGSPTRAYQASPLFPSPHTDGATEICGERCLDDERGELPLSTPWEHAVDGNTPILHQ